MEEKRNFYFKNSYDKYRLLAKNVTCQEANNIMKKFLEDHNFKSYYTRTWQEPNGNIVYDVGSHSEFFIFGYVDGAQDEF